LTAGARTIGWNRRWKASAGPGPRRRGLGLALVRRDGAGGPRASAELQLGEDGSLSLVLDPAVRDAGGETVLCALAARIVGARGDDVVPGTGEGEFALAEAEGGTPPLALSAAAVEECARRLRASMVEVGARLLGVPAAELDAAGGAIRARSGRELPFAEVGRECLRSGAPLVARASLPPANLPPAGAAFFAEVETDIETGQLRVTRLVGALGCGPAAEAALVEARVRGEALRALGHAVSGSLPDPVLTAIDAPEAEILFVPADAAVTPFGATSTTDLARRAVAAAVANAVAQTGPRIRDVPLAPIALRAGAASRP
jgi:CO/xanthine dehydrogenase Mo-binding subunit